MQTLVISIAAALALTLFLVIYVYNTLVRLRNRFRNAFSQIDVQLKRRHDLIPNLVNIAKGYLKHERETLEAVIKARRQAATAIKKASANPADGVALAGLAGAENMLGGALGRLFAVVESYPELKASDNMMQLSEELTSTENRIAFARQAFNDGVMHYNNAREVFPNNMLAGMFGFARAGLFELDSPGERMNPRVSIK